MTPTSPLTLRDRWALYLDLIRWSRPQGWLLLLWPTLAALWLASDGIPSVHMLAVFTLGTILMRSAGCAVNDVADRDFDRHVQRTAQRPITSGRLSVKEALAVGGVLTLASFALVLTTNVRTIAWSVGALAVTILYPFTKRFFAMPQAVLGVAFSFGIPMAFAAVQDQVPPVAWWLVAGNLAWVLAYDTEYAMVDRNDDLKIGMRTSAITLGRFDVAGVMGFYALCLACWWQAGQLLHLGWPWSLALGVAAAQAVWHGWLIRGRERERCFQAFRLNHWLGLTVWLGAVLDRALAALPPVGA
ncbi:4-hydroxybenzoate polyprenyltransferase [Aquabacterium commune]|uniref:4-hydroxybenzoate octaprenyltransferase n=1 Tax=Aquabacterium commune TaxID=70586 RepID=A0A4R6R5N7_9BURK|nr:4-hydroxybenzoate octaprenyltransferase [Aquabacterium commune]TDP81044.1 4-hydroxybenzoate polyprenyltransferase [Aquabacterium commune]